MLARLHVGTTVILRIPRLRLAEEIELFGRRWQAKKEHHVTLLNAEMTRAAGASRIEAARTGVAFRVRLEDELWMVVEGAAATLVRMCDVEQSEAFFRTIGLPVPPLHVTLYTSGTQRGIGLPTREKLLELGRRLDADEASRLLEQMRESRR